MRVNTGIQASRIYCLWGPRTNNGFDSILYQAGFQSSFFGVEAILNEGGIFFKSVIFAVATSKGD
jgi:hypothetical protein